MCSHHQKWLFKPLQCSKFFWWLYSLFLTHGASCRLLKRDWAQRQLDGPEIAALALTLLGGQKAWNASEILFLMIPKLDYIDYIKKPKTSDLLTSKNKHPSPRSQLFLGGVLGLPATAEAKRCCGNEQSMASVSKATFPGKNQPQIFDHQRHQGKMSQMWRNNGFFCWTFFNIWISIFPMFYQLSTSSLGCNQITAACHHVLPRRIGLHKNSSGETCCQAARSEIVTYLKFLLVFEIYKEDSNYTTTLISVLNFDHPLPIISHFKRRHHTKNSTQLKSLYLRSVS